MFSEGMVVMVGMKMRSTPESTRSLMCPCTSLAGKHTVSDVTACKPDSYILRVLAREMTGSNPRDEKNVRQKGMSSQKLRTRGRPMRMPLGSASFSCG